MTLQLSTNQVWEAVEKESFAVIGMVTAKNEARTVGIVYVVRDRRLYFGSSTDTWKVRHISANPHVSLTIAIDRRIPLLPWIKIPAATITFSGRARVLETGEIPPDLLQAVFSNKDVDEQFVADSCVIEVTPEKDFITYGVGITRRQMRNPERSRSRAPVNGEKPHLPEYREA
jgi:hypothetical protein